MDLVVVEIIPSVTFSPSVLAKMGALLILISFRSLGHNIRFLYHSQVRAKAFDFLVILAAISACEIRISVVAGGIVSLWIGLWHGIVYCIFGMVSKILL